MKTGRCTESVPKTTACGLFRFTDKSCLPGIHIATIPNDIIHYFRLGLQSEKEEKNPTLKLAGVWSDTPEEEVFSLQDEITERRRQAFLERPAR